MTTRIAALTASLLAFVPAQALACPVCGLAGPGDNGWAYALMSVILSALPLGMIGGTVFWLYRKSAERDAAELAAPQEDRPDVSQHQDAVQLRPAGDR